MKQPRRFLVFTNCRSFTGKTFVWDVVNLSGGLLGEIHWHAPWRRYCFFPYPDMVWDRNCLAEYERSETHAGAYAGTLD